jgi:GMP synthase-like glutamine amidotransferase
MKYLIVSHYTDGEKTMIDTLKKVDPEAVITIVKTFNGEELRKNPADFDAVFLTGGTPCVSQIEKYPWMAAEIEWLKNPVLKNMPLFASCLGHHIVAKAFGGIVEKDPAREEMDWTGITLDSASHEELLSDIPGQFNVFQFHHDAVTKIPDNAVNLAHSNRCENQIFKYTDRPWFGTQFHPEVDAAAGNAVYEKEGIQASPDTCDEMARLQLFRNFLLFVQQLKA